MKLNKTLSLIAGVMLLLAIPSIWPYGFYQLLRVLVSFVGVMNVYRTFKLNIQEWTVVMIAVVVLFNPVFPVSFTKGVWVVIDLITAILMFMLVSKLKNHE